MRRETKIILSDLPNTAVVFEEFVKSSISKQMQENKWNDMCNSLLYIISNLISYPEKYKHPEKIPERYAKLLGQSFEYILELHKLNKLKLNQNNFNTKSANLKLLQRLKNQDYNSSEPNSPKNNQKKNEKDK